jgi:hypothetical protein
LEEQLLVLAQQTVAPIDDGPHSPVPRPCCAAPGPQQRGVRIGRREVFDDLGYTLDEELRGEENSHLGGRQPMRRLRAAERSEAVLVLNRYPRLFLFTQFNGTGRTKAAISGVTHNAYREG